MADVPSAVAYGTAALGQAVYGTGAASAVWAYSPMDGVTVTAAAGAAAGAAASAPAPVVAASASPVRGSLTFGSGTGCTTGSLATVSFASTLASAPLSVVISPTTAATGTLQTYVTSITATGFTVSGGVAPTASQGATVYGITWYASL